MLCVRVGRGVDASAAAVQVSGGESHVFQREKEGRYRRKEWRGGAGGGGGENITRENARLPCNQQSHG